MPIATDPIELMSEVQRGGLEKQADQWGSCATYAQYRLPFQKTAAYLKPTYRVLDWGCGNGHFSYFLTRNGIRTVGYSFEDPPAHVRNSPLFEHVRGRPNDPVSIPFGAESFDVVFSIGVLEHVHEVGGDQKASLAEIERILKPGGLFLCFHLPNRYTWVEFVVRQANRWLKMHMHQHSRLYTYAQFTELLKGMHFEILESGRYNFIPRNRLTILPPAMTDSRLGARLIDSIDGFFCALLPWFCQNWFFVLRKNVSRGGPHVSSRAL
jgi:SAM-dependent methyltransferase